MKNLIFFAMFGFAVQSQAVGLIVLNCESDVAFTIMDDFSQGTLSISSGNNVGIAPMKKINSIEGSTEFEASLFMSKALIKVRGPKTSEGFQIYSVNIKITGEEGEKSKNLECTSF